MDGNGEGKTNEAWIEKNSIDLNLHKVFEVLVSLAEDPGHEMKELVPICKTLPNLLNKIPQQELEHMVEAFSKLVQLKITAGSIEDIPKQFTELLHKGLEVNGDVDS